MITRKFTDSGFISAYIVWHVVDDQTRIMDNEKYLYIQDIWVHETFRNTGIIKEFMNEIFVHPITQKVEFVYYHRKKRGVDVGLIPASRYLKYIKLGGKYGEHQSNDSTVTTDHSYA